MRKIRLFKSLGYYESAILLSCIICCWLICTLNQTTLPGCDEIGTADSAINYLLKGNWESYVWIYTYHPLHNFILCGWLSLFGISHLTVCALNIFIALIISIFLLKIIKKREMYNNKIGYIPCILLFWSLIPHSSGRIDCLMMLFTILLAEEIIPYAKRKEVNKRKLVIYSSCLMLTGIYSIPILLILGCCLILYYWKDFTIRQELIQKNKIIIISMLIVFLIICLFYFYNHRLLRFLQTYIRFNDNLNQYSANVLQYNSFKSRLAHGYSGMISILCISMSLISTVIMGKKRTWGLCLLSIFTILIPFLAICVGHYHLNYSWMMVVPSIVLFTTTTQITNKKSYSICICLASVAFFLFNQIKNFENADARAQIMTDVKVFLSKSSSLLNNQDNYIFFDARTSAEFYYELRKYDIKLSGKIRLFEPYTEAKEAFQNTLYKITNNQKIRNFGLEYFENFEDYHEPNIYTEGIVLLSTQEQYNKFNRIIHDQNLEYHVLNEYGNYHILKINNK